MVHCQIGQHLAVQVDMFLMQFADESGIGHTVRTDTGIDTYNPQIPEASLLGLTVTISISETLFPRVLGDGPDILPASELAAGQFHDLLSASPSGYDID